MTLDWQVLSLAAAALLGTARGHLPAATTTTILVTRTGSSDQNPHKLSHASRRHDSDQRISRSYAVTYDQLNARDSRLGGYGYAAEGKHAGGSRLPYVIGSKGKDGYDSYKKLSDLNLDDVGTGSIIGYDRRHDGRYHLSSDSDYRGGSSRNYGLGSSMYGGHSGSMRDMMFMNHGSGYNNMKGIRMNPMLDYPRGHSLGGYRFGGHRPLHNMGNHMNYIPGGGGYPMPYLRPYMSQGGGHGYPGMGMLGGLRGMMPGYQGMNYGLRGGPQGLSLGGYMPGSSFEGGGGYGPHSGYMMKKRSSSNQGKEIK